MEPETLLTPLCVRGRTALLSLHTQMPPVSITASKAARKVWGRRPLSESFYNGGLTHSELLEETSGLFIPQTLRVDTPPGNGSVSQRLTARQGWRDRVLYLDAGSGIDRCCSGAPSRYSARSQLFIGSGGAKGPFSIKL